MPKRDPNQTYEGMLVALAVYLLMGMGTYYYVISSQALDASNAPNVMWLLLYWNLISFVFTVTTLVLRHKRPDLGKVFTRGLNFFLLIILPFGTAIAVYGLLKVDRDAKAEPDSEAE